MREYVITTGGASISGTTTLTFIRTGAAPTTNNEFLRHWINQSQTAASWQTRVQLAVNAGTVTATSLTQVRQKEADVVSNITGTTTPAAGNCAINATVETTRTVVWEDAFNVLNGWLHIPTPPETRIQPAGAVSGLPLYLPLSPTARTAHLALLTHAM